MINSQAGIKCYQCNSNDDEWCQDRIRPQEDGIVECTLEKPHCFKTKVRTEIAEKDDGEKSVVLSGKYIFCQVVKFI